MWCALILSGGRKKAMQNVMFQSSPFCRKHCGSTELSFVTKGHSFSFPNEEKERLKKGFVKKGFVMKGHSIHNLLRKKSDQGACRRVCVCVCGCAEKHDDDGKGKIY